MVIKMFNNKYGDEGLTILLKEEISKASIEVDFLGDIKETRAYIMLLSNYFNPFKYYFINDSLTLIINNLNDIENEYTLGNITFKVNEIVSLENKIEELNNKVKDHKVDNSNLSKLEALCEVVYAKCLKLERTYYKLNKRYRFQSYLNRLNDYFYVLRIYINKEM